MIYINKEDIISVIQQRLIEESVVLSQGASVDLDDNIFLDNIEEKVIDLVISYISGRYKHEDIFADPPIRNGVLVTIIASIVVYRAVRRNAARKVPEDYLQLYNDAIKQLERIQSGAMKLVNCPVLVNVDGSSVSPLYGNNLNPDNFI